MPAVYLVDSTWIGASPARVAAAVAEPAAWRCWWPELSILAAEDRGVVGLRWRVRSNTSGLAGGMEVWLEPVRDGVVLHFFLRLDPLPGRSLPPRRLRREIDRQRRRAKRVFWGLADQLDPARINRLAGERGAV